MNSVKQLIDEVHQDSIDPYDAELVVSGHIMPDDPRGTAKRIFKLAFTNHAEELAVLQRRYVEAKQANHSRSDYGPLAIALDCRASDLDLALRTWCYEVWRDRFSGGEEADNWFTRYEEIGPEDSISGSLTDLVDHYFKHVA